VPWIANLGSQTSIASRLRQPGLVMMRMSPDLSLSMSEPGKAAVVPEIVSVRSVNGLMLLTARDRQRTGDLVARVLRQVQVRQRQEFCAARNDPAQRYVESHAAQRHARFLR
jgi:hypothetical protein